MLLHEKQQPKSEQRWRTNGKKSGGKIVASFAQLCTMVGSIDISLHIWPTNVFSFSDMFFFCLFLCSTMWLPKITDRSMKNSTTDKQWMNHLRFIFILSFPLYSLYIINFRPALCVRSCPYGSSHSIHNNEINFNVKQENER